MCYAGNVQVCTVLTRLLYADYLKFQVIEVAVEDAAFDITLCTVVCSHADLQVHDTNTPIKIQSYL
jgi:hypothetical protein